MKSKRRIDVMLSSTFIDLKQHREAVIAAMNGLQLTPLAQEFDASIPDADLIKASLTKVEAADVYVGLIGARYGQRPKCAVRNPKRLSLTELEYRRAVELNLPRLMFIMADDHELTLADLKLCRAEGDAGRRLHEDFIKLVRNDRIASEFSSPADLEVKANKSFFVLQRIVDEAQTGAAFPDSEPRADDKQPPCPPAFHYVRKPFLERQKFAGRSTELARIDQWATEPEAMLLFQGIGGMGKSMLTWHWLTTRALKVRGDWAGRLWYSFYEQGADLNDFCVHALAYIRHSPPSAFQGRRTFDLGEELRRELDARPWLLILDGLERVLVAYNRTGKEHMSDEEASVVRDGMGLDREPRDCFRPEDDDVLGMLAQASQGKLLASTRLTPSALMNVAGQAIPGVTRFALEGLAPDDAELVLRNANVRGDGWRMRQYLADKFDGHPLSVGIVAGQVTSFPEARGDFDCWVDHPEGGADPLLIANDLRGRQNHILARAFESLDPEEKALLGCIAIANIALTIDLLRLLNPKRPIEPKALDPPVRWSERELYLRTSSVEIDRAYVSWRDAASPEERSKAQVRIDQLRDTNFEERQRASEARLAERAGWHRKAVAADKWLLRALPRLEARGLLQYDAEHSSLDMHPAIRHTVLAGLSPEARNTTGSHVSDALSSRPIKPFKDARTLDDLSLAITRVEALNAAGRFEDSWRLFIDGGLKEALASLMYAYKALELLQVYFPSGWKSDPDALLERSYSDALHQAAWFLEEQGKAELALCLSEKSISLRLEKDERCSPRALDCLATYLSSCSKNAEAERIRQLASRLADAIGDSDDQIVIIESQAAYYLELGQLEIAEQLVAKLLSTKIEDERKARFLTLDIYFKFLAGTLTEAEVINHLRHMRELGDRRMEFWTINLLARWYQSQGNHSRALDAFADLIALANDTGWRGLAYYEARRALSLAAIGRQDEASRVAIKLEGAKGPPHALLAQLYLALGDHERALVHAFEGYKEAWGQGPPYHERWDLEICRTALTSLGEVEPTLPPFDPAKVEFFDFEMAIEKLIQQKLLDKENETDRKA